MLTKIKHLVNSYQNDLFIIISILLVSLISFGAGWLLAVKPYNQPVIIQDPIQSVILPAKAGIQSDSNNIDYRESENDAIQGIFVGSISSDKYHHPDCPWAKKISVENQVWFSSEQEAREAGYVKCGNLDKYLK